MALPQTNDKIPEYCNFAPRFFGALNKRRDHKVVFSPEGLAFIGKYFSDLG